MTETTDAIVIGAGVIGAAVALELNRAGRRTITIDKLPAAGYGPTSGSCAIIRVHYSTYDGIAMAWEGYHYWRDWKDYLGCDDESGIAEFRETGCLVMATDKNGMLKKHQELSEDLGIPYEYWTADKIEQRLPIYDMSCFYPAKRMDDPDFGKPTGGRVDGGVWWPTAGYVTDPQLSTHNLQRAAENEGGRFIFGRTVVDILKDGERVKGVKLDDGTEIHAPVVVNVAGPKAAEINRLAGALDDMKIKTRAIKQEVVHVPAPEGFDFYNDGFVISDSDIGCYVRPEKGNFILIGSEDPPCDEQVEVDWETYDRNFTDQWTHQAYRYAQRVPSLGIPSQMKGVVDVYDASTDWIPIYDKSSVPGFYMACGTSGNQYKNAPIAGKMMAALIDYCEGGKDHDTDPMQFTLPYIQREVSAGFYSRNREVNPESSMSVIG
jgi:sarcosine oxidase subunit beta